MQGRWLLFGIAGWLSACAGAAVPPPVEPEPEKPGNCSPKPELQATAIKKPDGVICTDREALVEMVASCNKKDALSCYKVGVCHTTNALVFARDPAKRAKTIAQAQKALRIACDGGVAEGCMVRAGLFEEQRNVPAQKKAACADAIRACHLGHKIGCADCVMCGAD